MILIHIDMKHLNKILAMLGLTTILMASCKQNQVEPTALASLNVTNAVIGGATLTLNTSALTVNNNNYSQFSVIAGQSQITLYPAATPANVYYNQTISTSNGDYYSLFLAGSSPSTVDAVLIKESYKNYTDSLCGVRFINLAPGSPAISVNITGNATNEVASLAYKGYSNFIKYPAKATNTSYAFQIKNASTGVVLASTTLSTPRFHNVTIVFRGLVGSSPAAGITTVNDY